MTSHWDDLSLTPDPSIPGRHHAVLSEAWTLAVAVQGGVLTALAVEAMATELGLPGQQLRTQTSVFSAPVRSGPVEIDVTVIREGRSMSQLRAEVHEPGASAGVTVLAVFGGPRRGPAFIDLEPPTAPDPAGLRSFRDPLPDDVPEAFRREPLPFWARVCETRPVLGRAPWEPFEPGPSDVVQWYRYDDAPVDDSGMLHRAVPLIACDMMPSSVSQKVGPGDEPWFGPSADYTVHLFDPAPSGWLLGHLRARAGGDGYASVEMALWSERRTLVAQACQVMFFTYLG